MITKSSTYRHNVAFHRRVIDVDVRPHLLEQFFFRDQAFTVLDEVSENRVCLGRQGNHLASTAQLARLGVEFVIVKDVEH
jgi:hypothetical protein